MRKHVLSALAAALVLVFASALPACGASPTASPADARTPPPVETATPSTIVYSAEPTDMLLTDSPDVTLCVDTDTFWPATTPALPIPPAFTLPPHVRQKPAVKAAPAPKYTGVKLLDKPARGKISIGVMPTVLYPTIKYYVPDDEAQQKLAYLFSGPGLLSLDRENGAYAGLTFATGTAKVSIYAYGELYEYVMSLLEKDCNMTALDPSDIRDLASAQINYNFSGKKCAQVITDPIDLEYLARRLSNGKAMSYSTSCEFQESVLTLKRKDGKVILLRLATDGCEVYFHDGMYYDYSLNPDSCENSRDILNLFDKILWEINRIG